VHQSAPSSRGGDPNSASLRRLIELLPGLTAESLAAIVAVAESMVARR